MTDASIDWDELRRLADLIARGQTYSTAITPATILALLDRAEKAEAEATRLREALTPSVATKGAYIGKFSFQHVVAVDESGNDYKVLIDVPWTTIKKIMAAIRARASALTGGDHG